MIGIMEEIDQEIVIEIIEVAEGIVEVVDMEEIDQEAHGEEVAEEEVDGEAAEEAEEAVVVAAEFKNQNMNQRNFIHN